MPPFFRATGGYPPDLTTSLCARPVRCCRAWRASISEDGSNRDVATFDGGTGGWRYLLEDLISGK